MYTKVHDVPFSSKYFSLFFEIHYVPSILILFLKKSTKQKNMFLQPRKFYEAQEGGGGIAYNPFEGAQEGEIKVIDADEPREEVEEKPEEKVQEVIEEKVEEKPVEEKPVEVKQEEPKEETKTEIKEEPVPEVKQPIFNFDEELKKVDKWEVMKKLGLDDFSIDLLKYKEQTGDVTPYLEAKTVDYSKFTDEQIMRHDLRKQYKGMSDKAFEMLYEQKVNEQFKLDAEVHGDAAAELGRELLKFEANKIRQREIEAQAKFKAPEKPVDDSAQKQQQEQEAKIAEYKSFVNDSEQTKTLLKDKRLVYGSGDTAFNFTVEKPSSLVDTALNPTLLFND
ncbi:MAG TPA: hypothetical protein VJ279_06915, partial [Hanamia sp.]|nr:hypothetical protein [Hanamia sp.]